MMIREFCRLLRFERIDSIVECLFPFFCLCGEYRICYLLGQIDRFSAHLLLHRLLFLSSVFFLFGDIGYELGLSRIILLIYFIHFFHGSLMRYHSTLLGFLDLEFLCSMHILYELEFLIEPHA